MRYVEEFRDPAAARRAAGAIAKAVTRPWTIMEVCGGQTHAIVRFGIDRLLPEALTLVHGPGCPVCVTPVSTIDAALAIAATPGAVLCSYGDMLRVPGSGDDLLSARAAGADVRMMYSPLDAVKLARENPGLQVVFLAVGFETTAPAHAAAVLQAKALGLENFSLLTSHVLVPPAMEAILGSEDNRVQGFLAAGHVCTVMGYREYEPIAERHAVPIVVTGFEPLDILSGILGCVQRLEAGEPVVDNAYARAVRRDGNPEARRVIQTVFRVSDREWRGIGTIPSSGLDLHEAFAAYDARGRFDLGEPEPEPDRGCISGLVLQGRARPADCPAFGKECTPDHPLGATMVSAEGACAAYYKYRGAERVAGEEQA